MDINLANLPADEKQKIELDKQAAYAVWKVVNNQAPQSLYEQEANVLVDWQRDVYLSSVNKYRAQPEAFIIPETATDTTER
ncbi:hypothetical protein BZG78_10165 [Salinivibrio sp. MA351]|jgi:hypothetical protein|uniref:DUF3283 family protein n=1 Tax=Salinivibrio costicola subsp. alcaliphilus TaxID=272773 RepID=A0ABX3KRD0_SALCS|nr:MULTISPECIES: DUF3283 family protein [Salinivibrio]NUY55849.1 DUF3283 family protein [Salinivibrio sp. EAGSL]OOE91422.1 hypothetical protein BZG76_10930 [Salinivibrio sp. AR647]OOE91573.1 hypothetical protein BZG75_10615 [Salinivibrio sp. AR640]OOE96471.1 hypothetical protein BZG77_11505 [Salinivibrio sp. IB643]OOE97980.1 hypothetical protein BZG78_10165 [Salinivibrio sp. MA351]